VPSTKVVNMELQKRPTSSRVPDVAPQDGPSRPSVPLNEKALPGQPESQQEGAKDLNATHATYVPGQPTATSGPQSSENDGVNQSTVSTSNPGTGGQLAVGNFGNPSVNVQAPTPSPIPEGESLDSGNREALTTADNGNTQMSDAPPAASSNPVGQNTNVPPPPPKADANGPPLDPQIAIEDKQQWLLPPIQPRFHGKKCLVLDLDETLVHSSFKVC
jgi:RNA polymerase II subunit A small phosphatase-like protein